MTTTPTSMINRLMGVESWTDPIALAAGSTIGGVVPAGTSANTPVNVTAATLTLTSVLHAGRLVTLNRAAGCVITPPAATGTGDLYTLFVGTTITSVSITIDAKAGAAADVFKGWLQTYKASTFTPYIANSNLNLITLDGSTQGGIIGDFIQMRDCATNVWVVSGFLTQSGTIATPFSNH